MDQVLNAEASSEVLGRVVFGTARGLFARGTGCMSGAGGAPEALELRSGDGRRVAPEIDQTVLFRRPLYLSTGAYVDLIAVANGVFDLEKRPGFLSYGIAVPRGDGEAFRRAAELLFAEFGPAQAHYIANKRFREGARDYALPGRTDRAFIGVSYSDPGRQTQILRLTLEAWWSPKNFGRALDALDIGASWSAEKSATIVVYPDAHQGAYPLTSELLDQLAKERNDRQDAEAREAAKHVSDLEALHGREDLIARRQIQELRERVAQTDRRLEKLERAFNNQRAHSMRSEPKTAFVNDDYGAEDGMMSRRRWTIAGTVVGGVFVFFGVVYLALQLLGVFSVDPAPQAQDTVIETPMATEAPDDGSFRSDVLENEVTPVPFPSEEAGARPQPLTDDAPIENR